jgi:hypothetical protein
MIRAVYIGTDNSGDRVWRLPSGRWTWGDTEEQALTRERTFTPERYEDKYGPINREEYQ